MVSGWILMVPWSCQTALMTWLTAFLKSSGLQGMPAFFCFWGQN
jgi:hypothetical protein